MFSLNNDFVSGAGTTLTFVMAVLALISFIRSRKRKIYYCKKMRRIVPSTSDYRYNVKVEVGETVGSSLDIETYLITNQNLQTVTDDDFTDSPTISCRSNAKILSVSSDNLCKTEISPDQKKIIITDLKLPRKESTMIKIMREAAENSYLDSPPRKLPDLKRRNENILIDAIFPSLLTVMASILVASLFDLEMDLELEAKVRFYTYTIIFLVASAYFLIKYFRTIRVFLYRLIGATKKEAIFIVDYDDRYSYSFR